MVRFGGGGWHSSATGRFLETVPHAHLASFKFTVTNSKPDEHGYAEADTDYRAKMKKLLTLLFLAIAVPAFAQSLTMKVGQRQQLAPTGRATGAPANWISSDPRVATVINSADSKLNGTVIAHKAGTVTVIGTANGTQTPIAITVTK